MDEGVVNEARTFNLNYLFHLIKPTLDLNVQDVLVELLESERYMAEFINSRLLTHPVSSLSPGEFATNGGRALLRTDVGYVYVDTGTYHPIGDSNKNLQVEVFPDKSRIEFEQNLVQEYD